MDGYVVTAIAGGYDRLRAPKVYENSIRYVCYTDQLSSLPSPWEKRPLPHPELDATRRCRYVKTMTHELLPQSDFVVWIDGNIRIQNEVAALVRARLQESPLWIPRHHSRSTVREEFDACQIQKKDDPEVMRRQIEHYFSAGFPDTFGLYETNVLIRRIGDRNLDHMMNGWWDQIQTWSTRDQISLPYVLWMSDMHLRPLPEGPRRTGYYFRKSLHKRRLFAAIWHKLRQKLQPY